MMRGLLSLCPSGTMISAAPEGTPPRWTVIKNVLWRNPGEKPLNALGGFGKYCLSPPPLRQPP